MKDLFLTNDLTVRHQWTNYHMWHFFLSYCKKMPTVSQFLSQGWPFFHHASLGMVLLGVYIYAVSASQRRKSLSPYLSGLLERYWEIYTILSMELVVHQLSGILMGRYFSTAACSPHQIYLAVGRKYLCLVGLNGLSVIKP